MFRMSHPQHGFQMVQPADRPMFDRAGWTVVEPESVIEQDQENLPDADQETEVPTEPRRRGRPRKVAVNGDSV